MAMRSQIWEWDLYRGTPVTGSVATTTFATVCSPIKELSLWSNSTGPPFPQYTAGVTYSTSILDPDDVCFEIWSAATINAVTVDGANRNITGLTPATTSTYIVDRGNGYKQNAIIYVFGDPPSVPNGNYQQYRVSAIYDGGLGYSTGAATTTTTSGSGSGLTINITSVTGGEITAYTIADGGSGYVVGDTVTVDGGTASAVLEITAITPIAGGSYIDLGVPFSVFVEKGNKLKNKPMTKETQFIVVEAFGCTPTSFFPGTVGGAGAWDTENYRGSKIRNSLGGPRAYMQFYVNTTGYFKDPDGVPRDGIPGNFAPYPLTLQFNACNQRKQTPVYILPTQTWDLKLTCYNDNLSASGSSQTFMIATAEGLVQAFFKYTLYDGVDCLIALRLLEAGITITPDNVDMFKRNMFENSTYSESNEKL